MKYVGLFEKSGIIKPWIVKLGDSSVFFEKSNKKHELPYLEISSVKLINRILFNSIEITTRHKQFIFSGFSKAVARQIKTEIESIVKNQIEADLQKNKKIYDQLIEQVEGLTNSEIYISKIDYERWYYELPEVWHSICSPLIGVDSLPEILRTPSRRLKEITDQASNYLENLNRKIIERAKSKNSKLFSTVEKYPLSEEQINSIVINEDRNLLIAAAGSGKTSTIVVKAVYLVETNQVSPEELLILAYNKDAQVEIENRLKSLVGITPNFNAIPEVKTFHGLGYNIISKSEQNPPTLADFASSSSSKQTDHISEIITDLYQSEPRFAQLWQEYLLVGKYPTPNLFEIKTKRAYEAHLKDLGLIRRIMRPGEELKIPTIDGNEVRSFEEAKIANWLTLKGVEYVYEKSYEYPGTVDDSSLKYNPDFYYPSADLYHEHFAINKEGKTPPFIDEDKYLKGIKWKRNLHKEKNTKLIETHSAHFWDGDVFELLEQQLIENGVEFSPRSKEEIDQLVADSFNPSLDSQIFLSFLNHFKANQCKFDDLWEKCHNLPDVARSHLFLNVFKFIFEKYQKRLSQNNEIDFHDQINLSCQLLESHNYKTPYKYLLVDEFQDISRDRKRLIDALLAQNNSTKLFCVGDDWQSIYRFSGSDIEIMVNFEDYFGSSSINYLTKTYRSYQGIVDVAAGFVQKNPSQIKKTVSAQENSDDPQIILRGYTDDFEQKSELERILNELNEASESDHCEVFILTRYTHQRIPIDQRFSNLKITYSTIHSSKGLEADFVILLNLAIDQYGFPSTISDDPLLNLVMPKPENYPHAEERRLMYVALTRAKKTVYLLSDQNKVSPFAIELSKSKGVLVENLVPKRANPCPVCDTGERQRRIGPYGAFWGCSNYPDCNFSEAVECPECGNGKLLLRESKYGKFLSCSKFPKCQHKESIK